MDNEKYGFPNSETTINLDTLQITLETEMLENFFEQYNEVSEQKKRNGHLILHIEGKTKDGKGKTLPLIAIPYDWA